MKIASINKTNYENNVSPSKTIVNSYPSVNNTGKDSVSFGGAMRPVNWVFKSIESAGFFMQFLVVDTLSMVAPRAWVGFHRDKDKTGKWNIQAGLEEFGRESLSGPSMNIIPMLFASFAVHKLLPSIKLDKDTLDGLSHNLKNIVESTKDESVLSDKSKLVKKLAEQIFDDAFGDEKYKGYKQEFVAKLEEATKSSPRLALFKKIANSKPINNKTEYEKAEEAFDALVVKMQNLTKDEAPVDPHKIELTTLVKNEKGESVATRINTSSQTFFEDFHNYTKDVVTKFLKKDPTLSTKEFLEKAATKAKVGRVSLAAAAFMAVGFFLLYLPKVYQQGKISPAQQSAQRAQNEVTGGANENK